MTFCLPTKCRYRQHCLAPASGEVGTIYDHPITQYEQFIEWYYSRHKGSGKSKATVISDGQVLIKFCLISEVSLKGVTAIRRNCTF